MQGESKCDFKDFDLLRKLTNQMFHVKVAEELR